MLDPISQGLEITRRLWPNVQTRLSRNLTFFGTEIKERGQEQQSWKK